MTEVIYADAGNIVNMNAVSPPDNANELPVDEFEARALKRAETFRKSGHAYALEHGTRTATIGLALSSSPLALLSWYASHFLDLCMSRMSANIKLTGLVRNFSSGQMKIRPWIRSWTPSLYTG